MAAAGNNRFAVTFGLLRQYISENQHQQSQQQTCGLPGSFLLPPPQEGMEEAEETADARTMQLFPTQAGTSSRPSRKRWALFFFHGIHACRRHAPFLFGWSFLHDDPSFAGRRSRRCLRFHLPSYTGVGCPCLRISQPTRRKSWSRWQGPGPRRPKSWRMKFRRFLRGRRPPSCYHFRPTCPSQGRRRWSGSSRRGSIGTFMYFGQIHEPFD